ncbi:MAG: tetratricopeptide repeat protein [Deltaproteobacteria bacterium]|nr:tetratricopeptide repeat protein [Deltaproteobacteria bacterium]
MRWSLVLLAACGGAPPRPQAPADEVLFYQGVDAAKSRETSRERAAFTQLLAEYPHSRFRDDATIQLADLAFDDKDLERARTLYESVHRTDERGWYVRYRLAWVEYNQGAFDAAVGELTDLAARSQGVIHAQAVVDAASWQYTRADELYAKHDMCAAAPLYAAVAATDTKQRDEAGYANVLATITCQHLDGAVPDGSAAWAPVLAALDLYVTHATTIEPAARFLRGRILYATDRWRDAATEFRALLAAAPADPSAEPAAALLLDSDVRAGVNPATDRKLACAIHAPDLATVCAQLAP